MKAFRSICSIAMVIISLSSGINSCAATKNTQKSSNAISAAVLKQVQIPRFTSLNAPKCKFSISFQDKNYSIMGSVRMITDSVIQFSITPFLGIEMYRAVLRPDSITIIDKNNHNYFSANYAFLQQKFGIHINFKDIQTVLSNQTFSIPSESDLSAISKSDDGYSWATTHNDLTANYSFNKSLQLTKTELGQTSSDAKFACSYSAFNTYETTTFPTQYTIEAGLGQKQTGLSLTFDKITFNSTPNISTMNLSDYSRVSFEQIFPF